MSQTNAIMQRIARMTELWEQFAASPPARLARWMLDHESAQMFDLFLELQSEEASDVPDLFVRFAEPFTASTGYGASLRDSLVQQYDEVRESLRAEGVPAEWQPPPRRRNEDEWGALLAAGESLQRAHAAIVRHVVFVLLPSEPADPELWREWLQQLLARTIPEHVRFLVADRTEAPALADLCPAEPERVMTLQPVLDMATAYLELLREVPGSGPGSLFRRFFVALGNAVSAGRIDQARRLADHASRIAAQQQWPQLQASVAILLGGALMARHDFAAAVECYRQGHRCVTEQTDEVSRNVALQARFAEASALLAAARPADAAQVYEQIHEAAAGLADGFAQLEGARMAAYCHELAGQRDSAWTCSLAALAAGESLGEAARQSTVPFAGQALVRLARERPAADLAGVRRRLDALLGPDWEQNPPRGTEP